MKVIKVYPLQKRSDTTILHGVRLKDATFHLIKYDIYGNALNMDDVKFPDRSGVVVSAGSGKKDFDKKLELYGKNDNNHNTCRLMYHVLTEAIDKTKQKNVGGAPQIIGLYRQKNAIEFGIIKNDQKFFHGFQYQDESIVINNLEWRNDNFERVDPATKKLKVGAQHQPF